MLLFLEHLKSTTQCDVKRVQAQALSLVSSHVQRPQLSFDWALCIWWWQVSLEMKTKYWKEKQTDSSALLSILAMSISLVLLPDHECSATPAGQARVSGVIPTSQNYNMWSAAVHIQTFPFFWPRKLQKKNNVTKRQGFYFYLLYADTVPQHLIATPVACDRDYNAGMLISYVSHILSPTILPSYSVIIIINGMTLWNS